MRYLPFKMLTGNNVCERDQSGRTQTPSACLLVKMLSFGHGVPPQMSARVEEGLENHRHCSTALPHRLQRLFAARPLPA